MGAATVGAVAGLSSGVIWRAGGVLGLGAELFSHRTLRGISKAPC
jgi:hypothetical protein